MAEFTKGPWLVKNRLDIHADHFATCVAHCYDRIRGSVRQSGMDEPLRSESEANACLIAASPTMYEYIVKKASEGDAEAQAIVTAVAESSRIARGTSENAAQWKRRVNRVDELGLL